MTGEDTTRRELRRLEETFAEAMQQLYAVGNGIARLRHELESAPAGGAPGPEAPAARVRDAAWQSPSGAAGWPGGARPGAVPEPLPTGTLPTAPQPTARPVPSPTLGPVRAPDPTSMHPAPSVPGAPAAAAIPGPPPVPPVPGWAPPASGTTAYALPPTAPAAPTTALGRWWQRESLVTRLLGVTGAVVTLAGLVMLLVLAVQQRWFGPVPRVVIGVILAAVLIGLAHVVRSRERAAGRPGHGAVALAGTGYAAAYLDVVAVTAVYHWLPALVGLVLAVAVAATGLFLARRWGSQVLAVLILLGAAMLLPAVAGRATWLLSAFMVVLAVASWPAQLGRPWPAVSAARLIPAALVIIPTIGLAQRRPEEPWAHIAVTGVFAIAGLVMATREARGKGFDTSALTLLVTALPLLAAMSGAEQPWRTVLFLFAAVLWLGYAALGESQHWLPGGTTVAAAGAGTLALLAAVVAHSDTTWTGTALLASALGYLLVAGATRSRTATWFGLVMSLIALLGYLRHPITVLVERTALRSDLEVTLVDSLVTVGLVVALAWLARRMTRLSRPVRRVVASSSWVAGLVVATTAVVSLGVLVGRMVDSDVAGFRAGHALATILWMSAAAWLLIRGLRRSSDADLAMWTGLGLAAAAVAKLFLYDLAVLRGIWRVLAFIVVGLILLATGAGYAKALERARTAHPDPTPGGPAGPTPGPDGPDEPVPTPPSGAPPASAPPVGTQAPEAPSAAPPVGPPPAAAPPVGAPAMAAPGIPPIPGEAPREPHGPLVPPA